MIWLSVILIALGFIIIGWIIGRHLSELRVLNVDSIPGAREKKIKISILRERLRRMAQGHGRVLKVLLAPVRAGVGRVGERAKQKIARLELAYEQARRLALGTRGKRTAQILGLVREAEEFERQEKFEEAEKKYIAVITLDSKNIDAYEGLGHLYLGQKKFDESRQAFNHILKLRKVDASVQVALGEVALAEGKPEEALPHFKKAVARRPGNPKYLDFMIETALAAGSKTDAESGLRLMRKTNPENQKIPEWERRVAGL